MTKEIGTEAVLENCRALINQIDAGLSAEEPFINVSSAAELLFYLEFAASALQRDATNSGPHPRWRGIKTKIRHQLSVALTAPRLRTLHRGSRCVVNRLSPFLSEDIGSALKGGVKVCQRNLVNEVPPLVTEYALNLARNDATPLQRGLQSGFLSRI
jgi:hypothetical protein